MTKRYNLEYLEEMCLSKNIKLVENYSNKKIMSQTFIKFECINCKEHATKQFINIEKFNALCKNCSYFTSKNRIKFDLNFLNKLCKEKSIITKKDYSLESLNSFTQIEFNCIDCGNNVSKKFQYIEKYDAKCNNCSSKCGKQKANQTILNKYGVKNISQSDEIKNKKKETTFKNYGVEHPLQNPEVMDKSVRTSYKSKTFTFSSGNKITCQGYEPFALQELILNNFNESDIITGCKNVPVIWYNDETAKKRKHFVDIFIPCQNKCIEVKSTWTIKDKKGNVFEKQTAAKELGYKYEIWVYDNNGNKIEFYD